MYKENTVRLSTTKNVYFLIWMMFTGFIINGFSASPQPVSGKSANLVSTSSITGTIIFEGKVPKMKVLKMDADPGCAIKHTGPVLSQTLVLGKNNTMANVFVKVVKGLSKKKYPTPKEAVVLDQNGCMYSPHVFGIMVDQTLRILNSDGILHNIHPLPKKNRKFNLAMPKSIKQTERSFKKVEEKMFVIKCDVHPWMKAYTSVMSHPFFNVTGKDGKFTIAGLEPGAYEIEAWHEKLGTQTAKVVVEAGKASSINFTFKRKK